MNSRQRVPSATQQVNLPESAIPASVIEAAKVAEVRLPSTPTPKLYPAKIASSILKITREIGKIVKRGENKFHSYAYAKWEDILDQLAPLIAEHGLIIIPNELHHNVLESIATIAITYEFTIVNEDGDVWPDKPKQTQLCKIRDSKNVIDDKASSKCFTQAQKYMMLALFKIRTQDMADADADSNPIPAQRKRPVPSTDGKTPPHLIPIIDGEAPAAWVARFIDKIAKADTEAEIDAWDKANDPVIGRVQQHSVDAYNKLVDALNEHQERVKPKVAQKAGADIHPPKNEMPDIPAQFRRTPEKPAINDNERDWIDGLKGAFSGCEDVGSLDAEQERLMEPQRGKVSEAAWQAAIDAYDAERDRIEAA